MTKAQRKLKEYYGNEDEKESDNKGTKTRWHGMIWIEVRKKESEKGTSKMTTVHGNRIKSRNQEIVK